MSKSQNNLQSARPDGWDATLELVSSHYQIEDEKRAKRVDALSSQIDDIEKRRLQRLKSDNIIKIAVRRTLGATTDLKPSTTLLDSVGNNSIWSKGLMVHQPRRAGKNSRN